MRASHLPQLSSRLIDGNSNDLVWRTCAADDFDLGEKEKLINHDAEEWIQEFLKDVQNAGKE